MQHRIEFRAGETDYVCQHLMPTKSVTLLVRIAKVTGFSLTGSSASVDSDLMSAVMNGLGGMLTKLDDKEVLSIVKELLSSVYVGTSVQPVNMDLQFIGKMDELFEVLGEVLKIQYANFSKRVAEKVMNVVKAALAKAAESSGSGTLPGSSGGSSSQE